MDFLRPSVSELDFIYNLTDFCLFFTRYRKKIKIMLAVTVLTPRHVSFCMKLYEASFRVLRQFFAGRSPVNKWHYRQRRPRSGKERGYVHL